MTRKVVRLCPANARSIRVAYKQIREAVLRDDVAGAERALKAAPPLYRAVHALVTFQAAYGEPRTTPRPAVLTGRTRILRGVEEHEARTKGGQIVWVRLDAKKPSRLVRVELPDEVS